MNEMKKETVKTDKKLELHISGYTVICSFAEKPNPAVTKRVKNCLPDSYAQKYKSGEKIA